MDVIDRASDPVLYVIVLIAVISDFRHMKISNRLILIGIGLALIFGILGRGIPAAAFVLWNISFPVLALYLFYLMGVIGAGDVKLFSVIGGFVNFKELICCMVFSFAAGAAISLAKLWYSGRLAEGLQEGCSYLQSVLRGNRMPYERDSEKKTNLIHFSLAILLGLLLAKVYTG